MSDSPTMMVGLAIPTLRELRSAVLAASEPDAAVDALREAGYAGGDAICDAFARWLSETRNEPVEIGDLSFADFRVGASAFFRDAGWGDMDIAYEEDDDVATVSIAGCWESDSGGCHITTGALASFLGRLAGYPVAVLETDCSVDGSCRFLIGNGEVMTHRWESLQGS